ncbi:alpha-2-HS-glycoprotein [Orycteropus afer afer]|uniref:Alpha-2-HS-glycoprotein n=1 Tax=Orycteropus afer afer TaxID=1230840 RepID=A0A8B6ZEX0_ORYAF|nr:alpha-2-HS-glycoprotein [Orycteropus afer afer]
MKSLILFLCLAQLWGCHSAPQGLGLAYRELNCDDPETEQAAQVAMDYINAHRLRGYKHVLNQIDKVKVWSRRPMGEVFELELDTLETTCHVLDPTPVANCTVRHFMDHAVEGDCDFRVLKQDGQFVVLFAKCDSSPDSAEDVIKICPDCPLLGPVNDTKVVHAVEAALAAFNAQSNGSYYQLLEVSRAQFMPLPPSTKVEFAVVATDCVAKDVTDPTKCNVPAEKQYGFCKARITEKAGGEDVSVTCTVFQTQPVVPQPRSDDINVAVDPPAPAPTLADPPVPALVGGPMVVAAPQPPPVHRVHYDLRHAFSGVVSMESTSGEAFHPVKPPVLTGPGPVVVGPGPVVVGPGPVLTGPGPVVVGPGSAAPVVSPCPGRVRHFKI